MAYSDFTIENVGEKLGITTEYASLFPNVQLVSPPTWLVETLERYAPSAMGSEKARSEFILAPVLIAARELSGKRYAVYSGQRLDLDASRGLNGETDFLMAIAPAGLPVKPPLITVVEAKKGDLELGLGQCAAEMIAAREFNERAHNPTRSIYGCVSNGQLWQFLRLEKQCITMDLDFYGLKELDKILGVFRAILEEYDRINAA